jgi:hypothetical protein
MKKRNQTGGKMRSVKWIELPVIIDYTADGGDIIIEQVTRPTDADVDAYIKINGNEINEHLLEDYREQTL